MSSLPRPRSFLTSLINAIGAIPLAQPELPPHRRHEQSNPLKSVPRSHRPLLTTLHVLFPTLLLPALDLLDRRLVTRLRLVPKPSDEERYESPDEDEQDDEQLDGREEEDEVGVFVPEPAPEQSQRARSKSRRSRHRSQPAPPEGDDDGEGKGAEEPISHIFTVKSSQSTHPRRRKDVVLGGVADDPGQKMYIVRLGAWNCTCAAFAFAAFPGSGSHALYGADQRGETPADEHGMGDGDGGGDWEFGGMSLDGTGEGGGVPCCKHLLACLLAERWTAGLGGYIEERRVGRNEMAGIVADI
ncbi:hypothetical protein NKR19_g4559 [Coniochaeta hoffmannii]|uniref:SWIM-type domain-containing protein n=1 Tax=Coniochaeta hoffmannii TaxID=91930 RepID=A0AA38VUU7_9PEZI|nr:hypothetical protein NKR19_g4559 [Coniochaeta hoffmannii]